MGVVDSSNNSPGMALNSPCWRSLPSIAFWPWNVPVRGPFGSPGFQGILEGVTRMGVLDWTWELKSLLMDVGMVSIDIR